MLHGSVVDGFGRDSSEFRLARAHELVVCSSLTPCGLRGPQDVWAKLLERLDPNRCFKHKYAGIL